MPTKRRRVTAEMEGKYIINMPKGTTPRTRKILEQQQAAKGTVLAGVTLGQRRCPFCCILQGWSHPIGTGPEAGCDGIQVALDQGHREGNRRGGKSITTSAPWSCT